MNAITITTNGIARELLNFWDLRAKEQAALLSEHGMTAEELSKMAESDEYHEVNLSWYFRYKGEVFNISDFIRISPPSANDPNPWVFRVAEDHPWVLGGWTGAHQDGSYLLVKYKDDGESVVVGKASGF